MDNGWAVIDTCRTIYTYGSRKFTGNGAGSTRSEIVEMEAWVGLAQTLHGLFMAVIGPVVVFTVRFSSPAQVIGGAGDYTCPP